MKIAVLKCYRNVVYRMGFYVVLMTELASF